MSRGVTPASANAAGHEDRAAVCERSSRPLSLYLNRSACPSTVTQAQPSELATSGLTLTNAPPQADVTQQSSRCSGSLIIGDASTSSMVTTLGSKALGLYWTCVEAATWSAANCSLVVPNSYMCRMATMA